MANVIPNPFILGDSIVKIGANNFEASVSSVEWVPSPVKAVFKGLTPAARYPVASGSDWVVNIGYPQDWASADALSRYLHEHEGETVAAEFQPVSGEPGITANITLVPGRIGGQGGALADGTVALDSSKPVLAAIA